MVKYVGVDVSKTSVTACVVTEKPRSPKTEARKAKTRKIDANADGVAQLVALGDVFILEPTGEYSRIWKTQLENAGKRLLFVAPRRVTNLRLYHGCTSKTDRNDAFFLALYGLENAADPTAFIPPHLEELRTLYLRHNFFSRLVNAQVNRLWQLLSYQWPEVCRTPNGKKPTTGRAFLRKQPYGLFDFLAGNAPRRLAYYQRRLENSIGEGPSDLARFLAVQIVEYESQAYACEVELSKLLRAEDFTRYHVIFDDFGFGPMTRTAVLSRIYPFERFLGVDGKPVIEYSLAPHQIACVAAPSAVAAKPPLSYR